MDWLTTGVPEWLMSRCGPSSSMHSLFLWKKIYSHPNNSRHPFFQPNCKSIMVMPMDLKEFDNFSAINWPFSSKFRPKLWISFFVQNAKFRNFVRFSSKTNFLCPYSSLEYDCTLPFVIASHFVNECTSVWLACFRHGLLKQFSNSWSRAVHQPTRCLH